MIEIEMALKIKNLMSLEEFKEKNYGKRGTKERDELEAGYENFKIGALIQDKRLEMGITQEQLAEKVGTTKSYISKIENNIKEARTFPMVYDELHEQHRAFHVL